MGSNNTERLLRWLAQQGLEHEVDTTWRLDGTDEKPVQNQIVRWLNQIESRFDDLMAAQQVALDWDEIRRELYLLSPDEAPLTEMVEQIRRTFARSGYSEEQRRRAVRLWRDFLFLQEEEVSPLQVMAGWLAALEYLLQGLYFTGSVTQGQMGKRHHVSTSTVGLRYRALVEQLQMELFDHPARKRLFARRAVAIEGRQMSESEFNRRLLRGELTLA